MEWIEAAFICWTLFKVWGWERADWYKVEDVRKDLLMREKITREEMISMIHLTERCRRVTWRMGVAGAVLLSLLLLLCRVIPARSFMAAAVPSWVMITSVLNFRAYHLEDELTQVLFKAIPALA